MNRSITLFGVGLVLLAVGLIAYPIAAGGAEVFDVEQAAGVLVFSVSASVVLWGLTSPDPSVTTVTGFLGNPDENELNRRLARRAPTGAARYRPSPRESVNCDACYTAMAAQEVLCPRCARRRACQACGKPLFRLAGAVRCGPCVKDEMYCDCPNLKKGRRLAWVRPTRLR